LERWHVQSGRYCFLGKSPGTVDPEHAFHKTTLKPDELCTAAKCCQRIAVLQTEAEAEVLKTFSTTRTWAMPRPNGDGNGRTSLKHPPFRGKVKSTLVEQESLVIDWF